MKEASADIHGRYGGHCKTAYTGSIPVVASAILSTKSTPTSYAEGARFPLTATLTATDYLEGE